MAIDNECLKGVLRKFAANQNSKITQDELIKSIDEIEAWSEGQKVTGEDLKKVLVDHINTQRQQIKIGASKRAKSLILAKDYHRWKTQDGFKEAIEDKGAFLLKPIKRILGFEPKHADEYAFYEHTFGSDAQVKNPSPNIDSLAKSVQDEATIPIIDGLESPLVKPKAKAIMAGEFDVEFYKLARDEKIKTNDPGIIEFYNTMKKSQNYIHGEKVDAGYDTAYLKEYITQRSPDPDKILANQDEFIQWMNKNRDYEGTGILETERVGDLRTSLQKIELRNTRSGKIVEQSLESTLLSSPGVREGMSRHWKFKSAEAEVEFNKLWGDDRPLVEQVMTSIRKESGNIGAAKKLGPAHRTAVQAIVDNSDWSLKRKEKALRYYDYTVNGAAKATDHALERYGLGLRMGSDVKNLPLALVSTFMDHFLHGGVQGSRVGQSYTLKTLQGLRDMAQQIPVVSKLAGVDNAKAFGQDITKKLGVFFDDMNVYSRANDRAGEISSTHNSKFKTKFGRAGEWVHSKFIGATGLRQQSAKARIAAAKGASNDLADEAGKAWADMHKGFKQGLEKMGIGEAEWKLAPYMIDTYGDDSKGLTKEGVDFIPDSVFKKELGMTDPKQILKTKSDLKLAISSYMRYWAEYSSPTPSAREDAWKHSVPANTVKGQVLRFIGQYKSFMIATENALEAVKAGGGYTAVAKTVVGTSAAGMAALYFNDLITGNDFEKRYKEGFGDLLWDAVGKGGGTGLVGDIFLQEYHRSYMTPLGAAAGPVLGGTVEDVWDFGAQLIRTDPRDAKERRQIAKKLVRHVVGNVPTIPFIGRRLNKSIIEGFNAAYDYGPETGASAFVERLKKNPFTDDKKKK